MAKKKHKPLPETLAYLRPFLDMLSKLPREDWNEDVDLSLLELALRERLRGLDSQAALEVVSQDSQQLDRWLKSFDSELHPARWALGTLSYLSMTGTVDYFLKPPPPPPRLPTAEFEAPAGWKMTRDSCGMIGVQKGKLIGVIQPVDEFGFENRLQDNEFKRSNMERLGPPGWKGTYDVKEIHAGDVAGKKYIFQQIAPAPWKRVDYVLRVPGGFVGVMLDAMGADFDEAPFEAKFHTLRVS